MADAEYILEESLDPEDWESIKALGHRMLDDMLDHARDLRDHPVWQHAPQAVKEHFSGPPPQDPQPPEEIYGEYLRYILPYHLGSNHPRFWGWVGGTGTIMGALAEMLATSANAVSGAFSYISANYVEIQVVVKVASIDTHC